MISGKIVDFDNMPIPGVIVQDNFGNGTQTDANGMYWFETQDGAIITASYFGNAVSETLNGDDTIDFTISTDFETGTVEIVATRSGKQKPLAETIALAILVLGIWWWVHKYVL